MIKVKANLLRFDTIDRIGIKFPKDCEINIPESIPITDSNQRQQIGLVTFTERNDSFIKIKGIIYSYSDSVYENELISLIKNQEIYVGGYYHINKESKEHEDCGTRIMESLNLMSVGLYSDDIYSDKTTVLEVLEDD